jgi:hypothetical protein
VERKGEVMLCDQRCMRQSGLGSSSHRCTISRLRMTAGILGRCDCCLLVLLAVKGRATLMGCAWDRCGWRPHLQRQRQRHLRGSCATCAGPAAVA